jgi:hypothetical protein
VALPMASQRQLTGMTGLQMALEVSRRTNILAQ